jgi:hypothetical protein
MDGGPIVPSSVSVQSDAVLNRKAPKEGAKGTEKNGRCFLGVLWACFADFAFSLQFLEALEAISKIASRNAAKNATSVI